MKDATGEYSNYEYVQKELLYAQKIYESQPGWSIINVTSKSIEEIASEIVAIARHSHPSDIDSVGHY